MVTKNPLVSIVVPSYNHAQHIEHCIESIVSQDYDNYELIVIDDGSFDDSPYILQKLQNKYGFYLEINKNQGLAKTLNRGFRDIAKGKYFTFCASDDYWMPGKLKKQVQFLEENPDFAMVYGKAIIADETGLILHDYNVKKEQKLKGGYIFKQLIFLDFHPPVNYMLRAKVIRELGYYREHIWAEDFDMNLRIAIKYPIGFINDFLSCYRINNSIPSKSLTFKTIYSHKDSIDQFKNSEFYNEAIKKWYYRCFTWYAPFKSGKILALKGMLRNLDMIYKKEFINSAIVLLVRWY